MTMTIIISPQWDPVNGKSQQRSGPEILPAAELEYYTGSDAEDPPLGAFFGMLIRALAQTPESA